MILIIDNYDSFVYNIARYVEEMGHTVALFRNDTITIEEIQALAPTKVIISPGPCTPYEAGISIKLIQSIGAYTPILGICLGHQAIGTAYGVPVIKACNPTHGKAQQVVVSASPLFEGCPTTLQVGCYFSLVVENPPHSSNLIVTGRSVHGEVMALQHRRHPVYGVQFHPESILTPWGRRIVGNFLQLERV